MANQIPTIATNKHKYIVYTNGLVPVHRLNTVQIPGSNRVSPLVPTPRKVLDMSGLACRLRAYSVFTDLATPRRVSWHMVPLPGVV